MRSRARWVGTAWGLLVALGACDAQPASVLLPPSSPGRSELLGRGDKLEIRVRDHEDLTGPYQVGDDGAIRFPWIGRIEVAGQHPQEVAEAIETRLADGWLRQPQVTVVVAERQNREVSVLGSVQAPGSYPYKDRMTLVQALSLAGGMEGAAQRRRVKLIRDTERGRQTFQIDVTAILDSRAEDLLLEPGDIIFVPESKI